MRLCQFLAVISAVKWRGRSSTLEPRSRRVKRVECGDGQRTALNQQQHGERYFKRSNHLTLVLYMFDIGSCDFTYCGSCDRMNKASVREDIND